MATELEKPLFVFLPDVPKSKEGACTKGVKVGEPSEMIFAAPCPVAEGLNDVIAWGETDAPNRVVLRRDGLSGLPVVCGTTRESTVVRTCLYPSSYVSSELFHLVYSSVFSSEKRKQESCPCHRLASASPRQPSLTVFSAVTWFSCILLQPLINIFSRLVLFGMFQRRVPCVIEEGKKEEEKANPLVCL